MGPTRDRRRREVDWPGLATERHGSVRRVRLPMAVHPDARQAPVIGLGGGVTAGAVAYHDGVSVDIVELSGAVVRGAQYFRHVNYGVLARPNARVHVADGRNFLQTTDRSYDVPERKTLLHEVPATCVNLIPLARCAHDQVVPTGALDASRDISEDIAVPELLHRFAQPAGRRFVGADCVGSDLRFGWRCPAESSRPGFRAPQLPRFQAPSFPAIFTVPCPPSALLSA
jgi:spermine/spermidine synthase